MATARRQPGGGGLSVTTLVIASAASVAAAIVVHEVWRGGAILGAAVTPVVVAIVSEALRRPVDRVTAIREERRARTEVRPGQAPPLPPPELERPDPFGIWQEAPAGRRLTRRHLKIAVITGVVAFAIGAVALTGAELVFGGNVGGGGDRVTIVPCRDDDEDRDKQETTETRPEEEQPTETETAPAETEPTTPTETVPTAPPTETVPPPAETVPPAESAPAPTTPAPPEVPGGEQAPPAG